MGASGCTFILTPSGGATQCETNDDCTALGADFAGTVCRENVCTTVEIGGCKSNQECIDSASGNPAICRESDPGTARQCVNLLSEDCIQVSGNVADDNAVVFGFMFPMKNDLAFLGDITRPVLELGIGDFTSNGTGIPGPSQTSRSLVMLACDEIEDPIRASRHLIETVGVPAILGPGITEFAVPVMTEVGIKNETLMILPFANSEASEKLPDSGLLWSLRGTERLQAQALVAAFSAAEEKIKAKMPTPGPLKVAVVVKQDDQGQSFGGFIADFLSFNGAPALDPANKSNYKRIDFPACTDIAEIDQCFIDALVRLQEFRPDVIFAVGQQEVYSLVASYEASVPEDGSAPAPHWYFTDGAFPPPDDILVDAGDLPSRLLGVFDYTDYGSPLYARFAQSYEGRFGELPVPGVEALYDAFYMMAYGIAAAQRAPRLTGKAIATGMTQLLGPGLDVQVGFADINKAFGALGGGATIDLDGLTGELHCDPNTGTCLRDWVVWCVGTDEQGAPALDPTGTYAVYRSAEGKIEGTFSCGE